MIEMLGVLAIIGVLSAGGIMGYSMAMEGYKTSKQIQEIETIVSQLNYLFKGKLTGKNVSIGGDRLCQINALPADLCKNKIKDHANAYYKIRGFNAPLGVVMVSLQEMINGVGWSGYVTGDKIFVGVDVLNLSSATCAKFVTKNWGYLTELGMQFSIVEYRNDTEFPNYTKGNGSGNSNTIVTAKQAESYCKINGENSSIRIEMRYYIMGKKV